MEHADDGAGVDDVDGRILTLNYRSDWISGDASFYYCLETPRKPQIRRQIACGGMKNANVDVSYFVKLKVHHLILLKQIDWTGNQTYLRELRCRRWVVSSQELKLSTL